MDTDDLRGWELGKVEDEVATLAARIAAMTGRFLVLLGELSRREAWAGQGFTSLAHWLGWRTGMSEATAREHVRVADKLRELPQTAETLSKGEISYSKARAITRVARPETEGQLLEMAKEATAAQLDRIVAGVVKADPARERTDADAIEQKRTLDTWFDDDGMLVIRGRLAPEEGALLMKALEAARRELFDQRPANATPGGVRADALVRVADRSLAAEAGRDGGDRTLVMVHVDHAVLADPSLDGECRFDDGRRAPAGARRLACDASIVEVTDDQPGRRHRIIRRALRRALHLRDKGCRFPGCTHKIVDAHHIHHWADGGPTTLGNLLEMCRFHHALVHEGGFRVEPGPKFFRPDGRPILLPVPPLLPDPAPAPNVGPHTLTARWTGYPIDYGRAISAVI